jgi:hypothetical protein
LLKEPVRHDEEIEQEMESNRLHRTTLPAPDRVEVRVHEGVVGFEGQADHRSEVSPPARPVACSEGILGVEDKTADRCDSCDFSTGKLGVPL